MALARLGELRSIQKLFDSGKASATSADPQGITALHVILPDEMRQGPGALTRHHSGLPSTDTTLSVTTFSKPAQT
jgi:hypothetical protein